MSKYFNDPSSAAKIEKKVTMRDMLKKKKKKPNCRSSYIPVLDQLSEHRHKSSHLSPEDQYLKPFSSQSKLDTMYHKISDVSTSNKFSSQSEKLFKKSITKNLKSLEPFDILSELEQKHLIQDYSSTVKLNMFSLKKTGVKYRQNSLRKLFSQRIKRTD